MVKGDKVKVDVVGSGHEYCTVLVRKKELVKNVGKEKVGVNAKIEVNLGKGMTASIGNSGKKETSGNLFNLIPS